MLRHRSSSRKPSCRHERLVTAAQVGKGGDDIRAMRPLDHLAGLDRPVIAATRPEPVNQGTKPVDPAERALRRWRDDRAATWVRRLSGVKSALALGVSSANGGLGRGGGVRGRLVASPGRRGVEQLGQHQAGQKRGHQEKGETAGTDVAEQEHARVLSCGVLVAFLTIALDTRGSGSKPVSPGSGRVLLTRGKSRRRKVRPCWRGQCRSALAIRAWGWKLDAIRERGGADKPEQNVVVAMRRCAGEAGERTEPYQVVLPWGRGATW